MPILTLAPKQNIFRSIVELQEILESLSFEPAEQSGVKHSLTSAPQ